MDSARLARQKTIDSNKQVLQHRSDSLNEIRKHKESKQYKDSIKNARDEIVNNLRETRAHISDSIKAERKHTLDSSIAERTRISDSIKSRLKIKSDSLASIRKIKESKHYKDSVAHARNTQINNMRETRKKYFDSVKTERKHVLDSAMAARKQISDALRKKQKARADSLAVIRKYKESKRYRDSVNVVRQERLDSLRTVRKIASDKIIAARKKSLDSAKAARKIISDALAAARKKTLDSVKAIQQVRADSIAKVKERKLKEQKAQLKKREEKQKLAFELKIAKKHKAFTNETMLKKKWTLVRQGFQNTYTHYNYFFNARRKMNEAMLNMQRRKKDNYDELITLFPFDPNVDSTVFSSDMDSIVRKASVGIQIHDPRTKWADDLYLLMGRAYYYKGNFTNADITFRYIIGMKNRFPKKKKKQKNIPAAQKNAGDANGLVQQEKQSRLAKLLKHKPAHNDAVLWLTRTFADSHHEAQAESILDLLDASTKLPESMKAKIALEKANLYTRRGDFKQASAQLDLVVHSKVTSKYMRQRASYLNGQILNDLGNYAAAAENFKQTYELHPNIEMDFYARKNRANSLMLNGGEQSASIASLKRILKDGKYSPYYEQVYFILGKLSANSNNTTDALAYFAKSLSLPKTSKKQKAITFAAIGNIQYAAGNYNAAKKAYDSASYFAKHAPDNQDVQLALRRGKSLDKVEEPYTSIQIQDSLLRLAAMSDKEQHAVVRKYIKYLEQLKQDSISNAQNPLGGAGSGAPGDPNSAASWYFSSQVAVQQGFNDFKRKWGNRPLADNWRRASSSSFGSTADSSNNNAGAETDADADEQDGNGLPSEKSLLAGIPKTEKQLEETRKKLRRSYVALADAYIKNLEDYKAGVKTLDTLDYRFPNHEYGDQVLSLRYLAALRQNKLEDAQKYSNLLAEKYPNSSFTKIVRPDDNDTVTHVDTTAKVSVAEYYTTTYELAHERRYDEVLQRVSVAKKQYGDATYARKFRVLEALSLAGTGQYKKADTAITKYLAEYPSDSLKPWIDAIAKNVKEQKAADTVKANSPKIDSTALIAKPKVDSTAQVKAIPDNYSYKPGEMHYCLFVFGKADVKIAGFKSGLVDFASFKYSSLGLTTTMQSLTADNTIVLTKQFGNAAQAKVFLNAVKNEPKLFRDIPSGSYQTIIISESNYAKLMRDKKIADYVTFFNKNYR